MVKIQKHSQLMSKYQSCFCKMDGMNSVVLTKLRLTKNRYSRNKTVIYFYLVFFFFFVTLKLIHCFPQIFYPLKTDNGIHCDKNNVTKLKKVPNQAMGEKQDAGETRILTPPHFQPP